MGNALVVYTMGEEGLGWVQRQREVRRRAERGESPGRTSTPPNFRQVAMSERGIPVGGVWSPPAEPETADWWRKPSLRRRHAKAVLDSLESFLNGHLSNLNHMVRTGWWVLGEARVKVVACRPVPQREMRAVAAALREWAPVRRSPSKRRAPRGRRT